jgi:hypothetical protein
MEKGGKVLEEEVMISVGQRQRGKKLTEQMWPTPTASDVEGGVAKDVQTANGRFFRQNEKGEKWGVKLRDAVNHTEKTRLLPTPTTRDYKDTGNIGKLEREQREKQFAKNNLQNEHRSQIGNLNSEWVTWLMGYPQGYLDISTENQNTSQELQRRKRPSQKAKGFRQ